MLKKCRIAGCLCLQDYSVVITVPCRIKASGAKVAPYKAIMEDGVCRTHRYERVGIQIATYISLREKERIDARVALSGFELEWNRTTITFNRDTQLVQRPGEKITKNFF